MICDVQIPGGDPYEGDPRYILKRALAKMEKMGLTTSNVGPELDTSISPHQNALNP